MTDLPECPICGVEVYVVAADGAIREGVEWYYLPCAHRVIDQL